MKALTFLLILTMVGCMKPTDADMATLKAAAESNNFAWDLNESEDGIYCVVLTRGLEVQATCDQNGPRAIERSLKKLATPKTVAWGTPR